MPDQEKQETGSTLMVIGWLLVLSALVVIFFEPGHAGRHLLAITAGALVILGLILNLAGYKIRKRGR